MFKNKKVYAIVLVSALVAALAFGVMAVSPIVTASAAEIDETGIARRGGPGGGRGGQRGGGDSAYLAEALGLTTEELQAAFEEVRSAGKPEEGTEKGAQLAEVLGITVSELEVAQEAARDAALAAAIAEGKITEEEAELIEARKALRNYMDKDEMLAKALGLTTDELAAAKDEGKRIPDLLDELGLDEDTFKANMDAAHEEALDQAVSDGVITQDQADEIGEGGFGGPKGPGGPGGKGPGRGGRGGEQGGPGNGGPGQPGGQSPADAGDNS